MSDEGTDITVHLEPGQRVVIIDADGKLLVDDERRLVTVPRRTPVGLVWFLLRLLTAASLVLVISTFVVWRVLEVRFDDERREDRREACLDRRRNAFSIADSVEHAPSTGPLADADVRLGLAQIADSIRADAESC